MALANGSLVFSLHVGDPVFVCGSPARHQQVAAAYGAASRQQEGQRQHQHQQQQQGGIQAGALGSSRFSFYTTLGLAPGSSRQDIKRAYRSLALKYHPDVCKGEHCAPRFKQINAAYEGLSRDGCAVSYLEYEDEEEDEEEEEQWNGGWEGAWMF